MEITIEKLLDGKPTIIKEKQYFETRRYVEPFIKFMAHFTKDFYVKAQMPQQLTFTNKTEDITYNRVWVQAVMPVQCDKDGFAETYNLVYGLDIKQPIYKIFKAYKDRKTGNLFVFDSRWLNEYELKPVTDFVNFETIIKNLMQMADDSDRRFHLMKGMYFSSEAENRQKQLGSLVENSMILSFRTKAGKVKIAPIMVLKAYESIYLTKSSKYYIGDTDCSLFNYMDAFANLIKEDSQKDLLNVWEKSALALRLFDTEVWK